jgi:hypothetical protein
MKKHHTGSPPRLFALLAGAALLFGMVSQSALAAGTASGTVINNSATLNYTVGGVTQTSISAAATFMVDEKINLTVTGGATTTVVPNQLLAVTTFTVTNNANSPLDFGLISNQVAAGDSFDATGCNVYVESGATAGYQAGVDIATFIDELAVDATATVYVVCNIPNTVVNTNSALVGLTATALGNFSGSNGTYVATPGVQGAAIVATVGANTSGVDIVFADSAGSETGDVARDAKHSARNMYSVITGVLGVTKTVVLLCDPLNGVTNPKNIPGSMTQWSLAVTNTGSAAATLTSITDTLAAVLGHDANLVVPTNAANCVSATGTPESGAGKGFKVTTNAARTIGTTLATTSGYFTTAIDSDGVDISGQAITATFAAILPADSGHATAGLLNAGETVTIIFNTTVQ